MGDYRPAVSKRSERRGKIIDRLIKVKSVKGEGSEGGGEVVQSRRIKIPTVYVKMGKRGG